ncbi:MAG: NAD-dependent deacylase [Bacteroidales bacterium]|nr:NAD-dependent deacylase [Bacteroidales bacterium]
MMCQQLTDNGQQTLLEKASEIISKAKKIVAFTGAGISAESGIPPFRGENGIWNKYDPDSLDIDYYYRHTKESWKVIKEIFFDFFNNNEIKPNPGHEVLAKWERDGKLKCVITQNIDDLHRIAGNKIVHEFHGNSSRFVCKQCDAVYPLKEINITEEPALCPRCGHLLKPDFIFFGEGIPYDAYKNSIDAANDCDVFIIIGTSGNVSPANMIPGMAKQHGATIIEINKDRSLYTDSITDIFLQGKAGEILPKLTVDND